MTGRLTIIRHILIAGTVLLCFCTCSQRSKSEVPDPVVVALPGRFESGALLWIAQDMQFFAKNNLAVTFFDAPSGEASIDCVLKGKADIGVSSEFPMVVEILKGQPIQTIGCVCKADFVFLLGRKDRGIRSVSDLRGKRIGFLSGSIQPFYLGRFLSLNGMSTSDITGVGLKTSEAAVEELSSGRLDGVVAAEPFASAASGRLKGDITVFRVQNYQYLYLLLVCEREWIVSHPKIVARFIESLVRAEEYLFQDPLKSNEIVQKRMGVDSQFMKSVWQRNLYSISLDESLVVAMEDEAWWMIREKQSESKSVPNFLPYCNQGGLAVVKPEAVNLIGR
jgi:ABC-type nitrate/sulfonate/bicarbonate transport system substrate-binding protein